ncbi:hypothetical protein MM440_16655 [Arsenicicoccus piscis]|uniref:hypothetical protein n=1 Tax=Arsenicicoccus piscis TaxID=673954 RepID=UPI001F4C76D9|nr:hypothetical protein [Arsenicicoccus piscis]MCH8629354.1 hypothetical protein [Arsenicicoccus piscis]
MSAAGLTVGSDLEPPTTTSRRRRLSPAMIAGLVFAAILVIAVLRTVTGENDLASSGALVAALGLAVPIAWPVSAACGPSGPASSTSASRA